jgi:hypothetical protein
MNQDSSENQRIKCPFCAELILPDAKICRFCRSDLGKDSAAPEKTSPPGLGRAIILNLVCPGLGAWRLGHKIRGAIVFFLVMGLLLLYVQEVIPVINKAVNTAIKTGNMRKLNSLTRNIKHNQWLDWTMYVYIYSFFELYFLVEKKKKSQVAQPDAKEL